MHQLYFVQVTAENSKEAREIAERELDANNFASNENGFFGSSKADWYVIGGRWSGALQEASLGIDFYQEVKNTFSPKEECGFSAQEIEEKKDELQKLWESLGGKDVNPFNRDQYHSDFEDDAMIIDEKLLESLKSRFTDDTVEVFDAEGCDEFPVKDLNKDSIGSWLVVIDYHN